MRKLVLTWGLQYENLITFSYRFETENMHEFRNRHVTASKYEGKYGAGGLQNLGNSSIVLHARRVRKR